ncbi:MAG TPA: hypothetical protein VE170_13055 [Candidatus Limnocylindria bacterium]|nr:hypothetical protein [Candidatus Limnocylindria bacterium]
MSGIHKLWAAPLFAFLLSGLSFGAETSSTKEPPKESAKTAPVKKKATKPKKPKVQKFVGNISSVDAKTGTVSVKGSAGEKSFITQDAAKDALERLAVGDRVRIQYSERDGKLAATSVRRVKLPQTKTKPSAPNPKATEQKNQPKKL